MSDINIGQISKALNDKMDRDANNIESPKLPVFLVAKQDPTSSNNYTWYRKYSDGWVEQGRRQYNLAYNSGQNITLPVAMADTDYVAYISGDNTTFAANSTLAAKAQTTTQVRLWNYNGASASMSVSFMVVGKAAS